MDVVSERQKALSKKYWKIIWSFAKDWFQLPKIILTIFIFTLFTIACRSKFGEYFLFSSLMIMCVYGLIKAFQLKNNFKKRIKLTGKKWMLEEMIFKTGMGSFLALPINFLI